jgi:hypothetical protein
MNTSKFADFVVKFDREAGKHTCQETTVTLNHNPLRVRLLFLDRTAFVRHRDRYGCIRVVFADCERIVRGIAQVDDIERDAAEWCATGEGRVAPDTVIITTPTLYTPIENAVREIIAATQRR